MIVNGYVDYVNGYLKYAHYECVIEDPEEEEYFKSLSEPEQKLFIRENGELIIDDYVVNDIGHITEII